MSRRVVLSKVRYDWDLRTLCVFAFTPGSQDPERTGPPTLLGDLGTVLYRAQLVDTFAR
jgi:hypothetical protein